MSIYVVTGKLGAGKTLSCVARIREKLKLGLRVMTNLDLVLDKLLPGHKARVDCIRIPDKPTVEDLESCGLGNVSRDESRNGVIVLDELGAWLNTRQWGDKDRQPVIDWLLHSRKKGWDVYFIIQHAAMVDKQVREGLAEFLVTCRRTDRLRVPFIGGALKAITRRDVRPPQVHVATVRYGIDPQALVVDRWWYRARELYAAYDTRQVFTADRTGPFSYVPPAQLETWARLDAQRRAATRVKHPVVELIASLPPDRRFSFWRRADRRGWLAAPSLQNALAPAGGD